jgi:hypothetical protein
MTDGKNNHDRGEKKWVRIPNGTKVRIGAGGRDGTIDGLTEFVSGSRRNPDGRTQYRVNVGEAERTLAVEDDLIILTDAEGLVLMPKQALEYRSYVSRQLQAALAPERFAKVTAS